MRNNRHKLQSLIKDGPGETHPLALTAVGLAIFVPILGFLVAFVARTQIAFSEGKYSGDRLALGAMWIAPIAQFSTLVLGALWIWVMAGLGN
jgi:hypothetical protein